MNFDFIGFIEALLSSVPEVTEVWQKLAPHISVNAEIPTDVMTDITALAPMAVAAVSASNSAIAALVVNHITAPVVLSSAPVLTDVVTAIAPAVLAVDPNLAPEAAVAEVVASVLEPAAHDADPIPSA